MLRRILVILAAAVGSFALCLFLALVLDLPKLVVYVVGLAPLFVAAAAVGPAGQNRDGR